MKKILTIIIAIAIMSTLIVACTDKAVNPKLQQEKENLLLGNSSFEIQYTIGNSDVSNREDFDFGKLHNDICREYYKTFDTNNDGKVTQDEVSHEEFTSKLALLINQVTLDSCGFSLHNTQALLDQAFADLDDLENYGIRKWCCDQENASAFIELAWEKSVFNDNDKDVLLNEVFPLVYTTLEDTTLTNLEVYNILANGLENLEENLTGNITKIHINMLIADFHYWLIEKTGSGGENLYSSLWRKVFIGVYDCIVGTGASVVTTPLGGTLIGTGLSIALDETLEYCDDKEAQK